MQSAQVHVPQHSKSVAAPIAGRNFVLLGGMFALGFVLRLFNAGYRFLNADEALHYLLSVQNSAFAAYRASLTTVHPPLFILWLHYWGKLGHSEFFLRFPCVVAGTLFCWVMFCWLRRVTNESVAILGVALFLFSPPLIQFSAELRQYAFLWLFCSLSLYYLERALADASIPMMALSSVALYLALLTHYSALIFALTLGVYALVRFASPRPCFGLLATWIVGQMLALALVAWLFLHHISKIESSGQAESIADSYLSRSVLHPGQNPLWFIGRSNLRLFHFFFAQGAVGVVGLLLFAAAIVFLLRGRSRALRSEATPRQLAFLLLFPLLVNCVLGLLHLYPYGGTRHNSYLSVFVYTGIAVALARWKPARIWLKPASVGAVLLVCNLFPSNIDQYIRLHSQKRRLIQKAVTELRSTPADSIVFTDDQGGLLLSYYMCGSKVVQIEEHPFKDFMWARCGNHSVISIDPDEWTFKTSTFADTLRKVQDRYHLNPRSKLWLFQAGWFIDKDGPLHAEFAQYGCPAPQFYGHNILICQIEVPDRVPQFFLDRQKPGK